MSASALGDWEGVVRAHGGLSRRARRGAVSGEGGGARGCTAARVNVKCGLLWPLTKSYNGGSAELVGPASLRAAPLPSPLPDRRRFVTSAGSSKHTSSLSSSATATPTAAAAAAAAAPPSPPPPRPRLPLALPPSGRGVAATAAASSAHLAPRAPPSPTPSRAFPNLGTDGAATASAAASSGAATAAARARSSAPPPPPPRPPPPPPPAPAPSRPAWDSTIRAPARGSPTAAVRDPAPADRE